MAVTKGQKAQTAIELAVFGAILIFVLGGIIRSTLNSASQQQALLKATRMAMQMSHLNSESKTTAARNYATALIIEDRLAADSGKYGAIQRTPYMSQGSATHSPNLFMPVAFDTAGNLPVMDVFVNGKHFVFTVSSHKSVELAKKCSTFPGPGPCPAKCDGDCTADSPEFYPPVAGASWEDNCIVKTKEETLACAGVIFPTPCPGACAGFCGAGAPGYYTITTVSNIGCAKLFTIIDNHPLIDRWCDDVADPCPANFLPVDDRFDLDRDGTTDVPVGERTNFSWQWFSVMGVDDNMGAGGYNTKTYSPNRLQADGNFSNVVVTAGMIGEGVVLPGGENKPQHVVVDVDDDLKLEYIMANREGGPAPNIIDDETRIILTLGVQDRQDGDYDLSYDDGDDAMGVLQPGFTSDINTYTYVHDAGLGGGTYLQIDEGRLFSGAGNLRQYIRSASKKDQVDLIERIFRLSNDTGAFCLGGVPPANANGVANPVEVCSTTPGGCFTSANIEQTCMDVANNIIFIRSRIEDLHGRKWVTDVSGDPFITFTGI